MLLIGFQIEANSYVLFVMLPMLPKFKYLHHQATWFTKGSNSLFFFQISLLPFSPLYCS